MARNENGGQAGTQDLMSGESEKMRRALASWDYGRMLAGRADRDAWVESEAPYIKEMIHRAAAIIASRLYRGLYQNR